MKEGLRWSLKEFCQHGAIWWVLILAAVLIFG